MLGKPQAIVGLTAALLSGCSASEASEVPGVARAYIVSELRFDAPDDQRRTPGFDLDGRDSTGGGTGCIDRVRDFDSTRDPAEHGVDDAFAPLARELANLAPECGEAPDKLACFAAEQTARIPSHDRAWVLEVTGIQSFRDDPEVELTIHAVELTHREELDARERFVPGQTFRRAPVAVDPAARIEGGRLFASPVGAIPLEIFLGMGATRSVTFHDAQLAVAQITPTTLLRGALGGAVPASELDGDCMVMDGICGLAEQFADLHPRFDGELGCSSLSMTVGFGAVSARLE